METYEIVRHYQHRAVKTIIKAGLTLEEAQAHCRDPETSSRTESEESITTKAYGAWFDGYAVEAK